MRHAPTVAEARVAFAEGGINVIIAAHNEEEQLHQTLCALAMQTVHVHPIVIDNASSDDTSGVAEYYGATVLQEPAQGKMHAVQTGPGVSARQTHARRANSFYGRR